LPGGVVADDIWPGSAREGSGAESRIRDDLLQTVRRSLIYGIASAVTCAPPEVRSRAVTAPHRRRQP
jgi:hypothetical protein